MNNDPNNFRLLRKMLRRQGIRAKGANEIEKRIREAGEANPKAAPPKKGGNGC